MYCITILCTVYALFHTDVVYIGDNHLIPSKKKKKSLNAVTSAVHPSPVFCSCFRTIFYVDL